MRQTKRLNGRRGAKDEQGEGGLDAAEEGIEVGEGQREKE